MPKIFRISGDNKATRLYVNDKLVEELNIVKRDFLFDEDQKPKHMYTVRTLVFPLQKAGTFNSSITNLKVVSE